MTKQDKIDQERQHLIESTFRCRCYPPGQMWDAPSRLAGYISWCRLAGLSPMSPETVIEFLHGYVRRHGASKNSQGLVACYNKLRKIFVDIECESPFDSPKVRDYIESVRSAPRPSSWEEIPLPGMLPRKANVANVLGYTQCCVESGILDPSIEIDELRRENQRLRVKIAIFERGWTPILLQSVTSLEMSTRSVNCLASMNVERVGDLVQLTEQNLLRSRNFGRRSLNEIKQILASMDLSLGMKLHPRWDEWQRDLGSAKPNQHKP